MLMTLLVACVRVQSGYALGPENDGTTKNVTVGSEVRLVLPADLDWQLEASNTKALVSRPRQWVRSGAPLCVSGPLT